MPHTRNVPFMPLCLSCFWAYHAFVPIMLVCLPVILLPLLLLCLSCPREFNSFHALMTYNLACCSSPGLQPRRRPLRPQEGVQEEAPEAEGPDEPRGRHVITFTVKEAIGNPLVSPVLVRVNKARRPKLLQGLLLHI